MAKEITWECTYCDSTNQYKDDTCVHCGATRTVDTKFVTIPSDKEEKTEITREDIKKSVEELTDLFNAAAGAMNALTPAVPRVSTFQRISRTLPNIKRVALGAVATVIIILILLVTLNILK